MGTQKKIILINNQNGMQDAMKSVVSKSEEIEKATLRGFYNNNKKETKNDISKLLDICEKYSLDKTYIEDLSLILKNRKVIKPDYFNLKFFFYLMETISESSNSLYVADIERFDENGQKLICDLIIEKFKLDKIEIVLNMLNKNIFYRFRLAIKEKRIENSKIMVIYNLINKEDQVFETEFVLLNQKGELENYPFGFFEEDDLLFGKIRETINE